MLTFHDLPLSASLLRNTFAYETRTRGSAWSAIGFSVAASAATAAFLSDRQRARQLFD